MVLKPVPMARIAVLGLRKDRQAVVSVLHDLEVVQLESLSKDVAVLLRSERDTDMSRQVSDELLRIRALRTVLPSMPVTQCQRFTSMEDLMQATKSIDVYSEVASLERQKESLLTEIKGTENNIKLIEEYSFFPEDLDVLQLSSANSYFGRIPSEKFPDFKKAIEAHQQDIFLYSKEEKKITYLVLVVFSSFPPQAFATLIQSHDVKIESVPKLSGRPNEIIKSQKNILDDLSQKLEQIDQQLTEISKKHFKNIVCVEEQLEIENKKQEVIGNLGVTDDAFALEGWIPKPKLEEVKATLQKHSTGTVIYELETEEKPPTLLKNPKRFKLFEAFIRFYSLPTGKEFDPTMIFALIFPVFYGLMVADTGYGLVILLVCLWVIRRIEGGKRNLNIMPRQLRSFAMLILKKRQMVKLSKAMIPGCIIAIILGFVFDLHFGFHANGYLFDYLGSVGVTGLPGPGEILNRPSQAFLDPIHDAGILLLIAGYVGIGMVSFGLILGIMNSLREGEKREAIGKIGWLAFGWGIVLMGLGIIHDEALNPMNPHFISNNPAGLLYFGLLFGGIGLMFVGEGVRAIMELASIVSHILSYTRLVGILLASVILAHTIDYIFLKALNISIPFIILGTLILFVGHLFNIIIGVFEPGIQGARLIYVEFFSKFFHGNGRKFEPFGTIRKFTYGQYDLEALKKEQITVRNIK
ncbi:MAG: V-type ATP synthase subunit I [Thermoproteota archaeon]